MTDNGPLIIGVEGKADEPFDKPLWRWRQDLVKQRPDSGAPQRLDQLTRLFFNTTIDRDRDYPPLACMGYQLLSALAGTLADAKNATAAGAVVLVHEFVTDETTDSKHLANAHALEAFLGRLFGGQPRRAEIEGGWITEPTVIRGDGAWMPRSLPVAFAKLQTNRRAA